MAYHLISRFVDRDWFIKTEQERQDYLDLLGRALTTSDWRCLAYAVMSNHTHLVTYAEESQSISAFMQKVQGEFAQAYNRRNQRSGAFWSDRFHSTIIEPGCHLERDQRSHRCRRRHRSTGRRRDCRRGRGAGRG